MKNQKFNNKEKIPVKEILQKKLPEIVALLNLTAAKIGMQNLRQ